MDIAFLGDRLYNPFDILLYLKIVRSIRIIGMRQEKQSFYLSC
jgi:hypothetical protein